MIGVSTMANAQMDTGVQLKDLVGIWKPNLFEDDVTNVIKFSGDGTYRIAWNIDMIDTRPVDRGQTKLEGDHVIFIPSESPACGKNAGNYTIKMTEKGNLKFTLQEDLCDRRCCLFGRELIRMVP